MKSCSAMTLVIVLAAAAFCAQTLPKKSAATAHSEAATANGNSEMTRLAGMFAGEWNTTEHMEKTEEFPNGGDRRGRSQCGLNVLGLILVCHGNSDGSAGRLSYMITIWWDKNAALYQFFTCFNDSRSPCRVRGTGHWEQDSFVNEYEQTVDAKKVRAWDIFTQTSPTTRKLEYLRDAGNGRRKLMITSTSTLR